MSLNATQPASPPSPPPAAPDSTTDAGHRIWVGTMDRNVTTQLVRANFEQFGEIKAKILFRVEILNPAGAEAVIK